VANIDHVAIGPGGVFVIDSKNWRGRVEVRDGILRQNGYKREKAVAAAADSALAVAEVLGGFDARLVRPVICLVSNEPVWAQSREVLICSTANVADVLTQHPLVLAPPGVLRTAARLRQSLPGASGGDAPRAASRSMPSRATRPQAPRSTPRSLGTALASRLLVLALLGVAGLMIGGFAARCPRRLGGWH
jgi:hypothetical protein